MRASGAASAGEADRADVNGPKEDRQDAGEEEGEEEGLDHVEEEDADGEDGAAENQ